MTKKDLKNGMIVEIRDGNRYLYCNETFRSLTDYFPVETINDNLTDVDGRIEFDIIKVYKDTRFYSLENIFENQCLNLIWQRPETPKLSEKEIEILKALKVLGYKYIARDKGGNIFAYLPKPIKERTGIWFFSKNVHPDKVQSIKLKKDLFSFVEWKDNEPTNVLNLLSIIN